MNWPHQPNMADTFGVALKFGINEAIALGCVDICIMLSRCQQSRYLQNNGQMCLSSFVGSQTSTSDGKPNVDGSSRLSSRERQTPLRQPCEKATTI